MVPNSYQQLNMFNVDESGLKICHKPGKVIAQRGKRSVDMMNLLGTPYWGTRCGCVE
jgi:hypothetical protein